MKRRLSGLLTRVLLLAAVSAAFLPAQAMEVRQLTTPKGIELWFVKDANLPIVQMKLLWKGGAANFSPGTVDFLSTMLDEGAGGLDDKAFQTRKESFGIQLHFSAEQDGFRGSLTTLSKHAAEAFDLLHLALTQPRFDPEPLERMRQALTAGHRQAAADGGQLVSEAWFREAFGKHPYGTPVRGSSEATARTTAAMLREAHKKLLARDNLIISVVGDIGETRLQELIDKTFAALPAKAGFAEVPPPTGPGRGKILAAPSAPIAMIDFPGPQTEIMFGHAGVLFGDPDYYPAVVVNHILGGGGFSARLMNEIRENRGLVYGIYSYMTEIGAVPLWVGRMATSHKNVSEALSVLRRELRRMREEGPSEDELTQAKNHLTGSYALGFDSGRKIALRMLSAQYLGLSPAHFDRRNGYIEKIGIEDVRRAAGKLLMPEMLHVTAVGQPAAEQSGN